jgi:hypothetical protein
MTYLLLSKFCILPFSNFEDQYIISMLNVLIKGCYKVFSLSLYVSYYTNTCHSDKKGHYMLFKD